MCDKYTGGINKTINPISLDGMIFDVALCLYFIQIFQNTVNFTKNIKIHSYECIELREVSVDVSVQCRLSNSTIPYRSRVKCSVNIQARIQEKKARGRGGRWQDFCG